MVKMWHSWYGHGLATVVQAVAYSKGQSFQQLCTTGLEGAASAIDPLLTISNATYVGAGQFTTAGGFNETNGEPFCRVFATASFPKHNSVDFEVFLPETANYNNRFLVLGNAGLAGVIDELSLVASLNSGYASAAGDSGHRASENNNGNGAPGVYLPFLHNRYQTEAWIHNSIAYVTPLAKRIVEKFYNSTPEYTYYQGCSTGGAQGFALAQIYPDLFDGIVAGSPGNWYSHLALSFLWNVADNKSPGFLSQDDLNLITNAVLDNCDTLDGVADRVIENPLACDFGVASLQCRGRKMASCLTKDQIAQAEKIYGGPKNSRTGASLYPGFDLGSESSWGMQESVLANAFTIPILQNLVFNNLTYDSSTFDWDKDVDTVDERAGCLIDEISPDLSAFRSHGAKMVVTQAWSDPLNAAAWPIEHHEQLKKEMGGNVEDFFALFMVPGGGHCGSNAAYPQVPGNWHSFDTLVNWVEKGVKPLQMLASGPADGSNSTKKLCPWPKNARYAGGNVNDWQSFVCV